MKRHDVEPPMAEVDIKLAEKLDRCLNISATRKPRFFMNKPKGATAKSPTDKLKDLDTGSLKPRNLTPEEIKQRVAKHYDTLAPELDPKRTKVKLVKVLSAKESLELGKDEARRQLNDQLKLSSVGGNRTALVNGTDSFKFNDGYETQSKHFYSKRFDVFRIGKTLDKPSKGDERKQATDKEEAGEQSEGTEAAQRKPQTKSSKSVKFADPIGANEADEDVMPNPYDFFAPDEDDDILTDDDADHDREEEEEESDYTTGDEGVNGS